MADGGTRIPLREGIPAGGSDAAAWCLLVVTAAATQLLAYVSSLKVDA